MALVKCTECGRDVSDKAPACPNCGAPQKEPTTSGALPPSAATPPAPAKPRRKTSPIAWAALALIIGALIYYAPEMRQSSRPPLPVEVKYRQALLGRGLVVSVGNQTDRNLSVVLTLKNPTTNTQRTWRLDLTPRGISEIGHLEGWVGASGDLISLRHTDYQDWSGSIP